MKTFNTAGDAKDYSLNNPTETVEYKTYWRNGQLMFNCFYVNGSYHGKFKEYHENGSLYEHGFYVNGLLHGEYKWYFSDGQLDNHCFFVNGDEINVDHLRDGSYKSKCILSTIFNGNLINEYI